MRWSPQHFTVTLEVPQPRAIVWEILSDTNRLNRIIGLPFVEYDPIAQGTSKATRIAQAKTAGVPMRWKEHPFQWEKHSFYVVRREYSAGPVALFEGGIELRDVFDSGGSPSTVVTISATLTPSGALGAAVIPTMSRDNLRKTLAHLQTQLAVEPDSRPHESVNALINDKALKIALEGMPVGTLPEGTFIDDLAKQLERYICDRSDEEVLAMRPHELARLWKAPLYDVLKFCLHAANEGALNFHWSVMCPSCRIAKADLSNLHALDETIHCDLCGIDYRTTFDKFVELRFAVHPAIRQAKQNTFCIGGPFLTPHVWVQKIISAGATTPLRIPYLDEELRIRVLRANHSVPIEVMGKVPEPHLSLSVDGWNYKAIGRPENGEILVRNDTSAEIVIVVEETAWNSDAVTAAQVTSLQEFRDLFATEALAPGIQIGVEQITLFFSDLRGSTSLYEEQGDAVAYSHVRRHFEYMTGYIREFNGGVVKTIGDAVMAVFYSPVDAVRAALAIQINARSGGLDDKIILKIGIHHGSAIAVNSNGILDYFGRSVNIASRTENASQGGDIILSDACWGQPEVRRVFNAAGVPVEPLDARLKGIEQTVPLFRAIVWPTEADDRPPIFPDRRRTDRRESERRIPTPASLIERLTNGKLESQEFPFEERRLHERRAGQRRHSFRRAILKPRDQK